MYDPATVDLADICSQSHSGAPQERNGDVANFFATMCHTKANKVSPAFCFVLQEALDEAVTRITKREDVIFMTIAKLSTDGVIQNLGK